MIHKWMHTITRKRHYIAAEISQDFSHSGVTRVLEYGGHLGAHGHFRVKSIQAEKGRSEYLGKFTYILFQSYLQPPLEISQQFCANPTTGPSLNDWGGRGLTFTLG